MPVRQPNITVNPQLQVITPQLCTATKTPVFTRIVIVIENVSTQHPVVHIRPVTGTEVNCISLLAPANAQLGKNKILVGVVKRNEHITGKLPAAPQRDLSVTELIEPVVYSLVNQSFANSPGIINGSIRSVLAGEHGPHLHGTGGQRPFRFRRPFRNMPLQHVF